MDASTTQRYLDDERIAEFYHDLFVDTQVRHFSDICGDRIADRNRVVSDIGGGCGFFASALSKVLDLRTRVIDADPVSVERARELGVEAFVGDALQLDPRGDEAAACFNLILHHLVSRNEAETTRLQMQALSRWKQSGALVFVNEYIYDSYVGGFSGALIYGITSSRLLSRLAASIARVAPSLRANTFGVGVRFRSAQEWTDLFSGHGWNVLATTRGEDEHVSIARRLLLIRSCRRDSFVLKTA